MSDVIDFSGSTQQMSVLVGGTAEAQLASPTPTGLTVAELLGHVHDLAEAFRDAAAKTETPMTSSAPDPAWRDPSAWEGMTRAGGLEMPGAAAAAVALDELVVHGWDLAVGTGQDFAPDPAALHAAEGFCASVPDAPEARQGLFGPRVAVRAGSTQLDRVLGLAGRDPGWRPAP